eukprot:CAMPEP_0179203742 /NCGR_PEP_ID=MMETSP0796-20121207/101563_1 /TAXON_ID=73915 /ORGANISM="Pyrodinium bahamense, Strain pbaha01" /LENGTH=298 /DNA_ID=CAMNT_0020908615 /DNA_START=18 /DNA_END=911 /DNA_ORIENTATION=+
MSIAEQGPEDGRGSDDVASTSGASEASSSGSRGGRATLQLCPLDLRFSQKKMRNVFADGRLIEDAVELVRAVSRPADEAELYDAAWRLEAPFPPIEVLRWRCKLRDEMTGRPLLDETGREMFEATESWFTLDNRRLYCLQKVAARLWPERCTVDVIAEIRKDRRMREIRKFRTLDSGQSIMVGSRVDCVPFKRWAWQAAVAAQQQQAAVAARQMAGAAEAGGPTPGAPTVAGQAAAAREAARAPAAAPRAPGPRAAAGASRGGCRGGAAGGGKGSGKGKGVEGAGKGLKGSAPAPSAG